MNRTEQENAFLKWSESIIPFFHFLPVCSFSTPTTIAKKTEPEIRDYRGFIFILSLIRSHTNLIHPLMNNDEIKHILHEEMGDPSPQWNNVIDTFARLYDIPCLYMIVSGDKYIIRSSQTIYQTWAALSYRNLMPIIFVDRARQSFYAFDFLIRVPDFTNENVVRELNRACPKDEEIVDKFKYVRGPHLTIMPKNYMYLEGDSMITEDVLIDFPDKHISQSFLSWSTIPWQYIYQEIKSGNVYKRYNAIYTSVKYGLFAFKPSQQAKRDFEIIAEGYITENIPTTKKVSYLQVIISHTVSTMQHHKIKNMAVRKLIPLYKSSQYYSINKK